MIPSTESQLLCHFIGDYILQSDWMAAKKSLDHRAALAHGLVYAVPFMFISQSILAIIVIALTHAVIDDLRLARYVVWAKNFISPRSEWPKSFNECSSTGSSPEKPAYIAVWLLIIIDNIMHIVINALALKFLA